MWKTFLNTVFLGFVSNTGLHLSIFVIRSPCRFTTILIILTSSKTVTRPGIDIFFFSQANDKIHWKYTRRRVTDCVTTMTMPAPQQLLSVPPGHIFKDVNIITAAVTTFGPKKRFFLRFRDVLMIVGHSSHVWFSWTTVFKTFYRQVKTLYRAKRTRNPSLLVSVELGSPSQIEFNDIIQKYFSSSQTFRYYNAFNVNFILSHYYINTLALTPNEKHKKNYLIDFIFYIKTRAHGINVRKMYFITVQSCRNVNVISINEWK